MTPDMKASDQRLLDLVRQQRMELHKVGLITDREYADLASDSDAVTRLETYDQMRTQILALTEERNALRRTLGSARASIRLVLNRDKISEWTADALREAETEIDAALRGKEKP